MVHGLAGYSEGCRCVVCTSTQQAHEKALANGERLRWNSIDRAAGVSDTQLMECGTAALANAHTPWTEEQIEIALDPALTVRQAATLLRRTTLAVNIARRRFRRITATEPGTP